MSDVQRKKGSLEPPHSIDAEIAVLGSIMKDPEAMNRVVEVIDSEVHFYSLRHRKIFAAILELYKLSLPFDLSMVSEKLLSTGNLDSIGGRSTLVEIVEMVGATAHARHFADIVLERSLLRQLVQASSEVSENCYRSGVSADELLDQAESVIFQLSEYKLRKGFVSIDKPVETIFTRIQSDPDDPIFHDIVKTGYSRLDELIEGLHKGDLVIIAGRPAMGKTALAMNIAENIALGSKLPVGIFSLEMSKEQLVTRMLCGQARVNAKKIRRGHLSNVEVDALTRAGGPLALAPIYIDDSSTLTSLELKAKARRLKQQVPTLSAIIVDYLQLMTASGGFENRQQEVALITRSMKSIAKDLNIPVIAISQLSRMVEQRGKDRVPQLSDLRESGAIEQDADIVMFVYREEYYLNQTERNDPDNYAKLGKAEVIVAKQRNGPTGSAHLVFLKEYTRFENLSVESEIDAREDRIKQSGYSPL